MQSSNDGKECKCGTSITSASDNYKSRFESSLKAAKQAQQQCGQVSSEAIGLKMNLETILTNVQTLEDTLNGETFMLAEAAGPLKDTLNALGKAMYGDEAENTYEITRSEESLKKFSEWIDRDQMNYPVPFERCRRKGEIGGIA